MIRLRDFCVHSGDIFSVGWMFYTLLTVYWPYRSPGQTERNPELFECQILRLGCTIYAKAARLSNEREQVACL